MNWVIAVVIFVVIGYILNREIYSYEGVHFGPRVQEWLYDRWSKKYDEGKRASQLRDQETLARPLLDGLSNVPEPFILDFAVGGRLSIPLQNHCFFRNVFLIRYEITVTRFIRRRRS